MLCSLLLLLGCSTAPTPSINPDAVRQHADKAFQQLKTQEQPSQQVDFRTSSQPAQSGEATSPTASTVQKGAQIPLAEIGSSNDAYIRATGYGALANGRYLCQHSADLAARVALSKLVRVQVKEKSVDRIRERTGRDTEQDIEVVREGLVDQVLSDVRIVNRTVDKAAGTCASTAGIPKRNLAPAPVIPAVRNSAAQ